MASPPTIWIFPAADGGRPARRADGRPPRWEALRPAAPAGGQTPAPAMVGPTVVTPAPTPPQPLPAPLRRLLALRGADGLRARDVLRARLAPDAQAARTLLDELAAHGSLVRREQRPARGGKVLVTYHAPGDAACP